MPGAGEDGEVAALPEFGAFFPSRMNGGAALGSSPQPVGADHVPDFTQGLVAGFKGMIAGEGFLFKVKEINGGVGQTGKGDVTEGCAADRRNAVDAWLVRPRTAGNDQKVIKVLDEDLRNAKVMEPWGIEASSEEGDAARHGSHVNR